MFLSRSEKFCSWLKFCKCKGERPLGDLLGHLVAEHGGSGHYTQNSLEFVLFKDKVPIEGNLHRSSKIFTCWIRGTQNENGVGNHECFLFILLITYGKNSVYWTPFIIPSTKALMDEPLRCRLTLRRETLVHFML